MIPATQEEDTVSSESKIINPFPGLRPFNYNESHLFFGREQQIDEVVDKLTQNRFVAVVGTSGIGKSSFMYCGLMPVLYRELATPFTDNWDVTVCRPGFAPLKNLANSLSSFGTINSDAAENIGQLDDNREEVTKEFDFFTLKDSSKGLTKIFKEKYQSKQANYLLFIDQFEELFRFKSDSGPTEADLFIELITEAVSQEEIPVYIVITLRSDFIGECSRYPKFTKYINNSQFLIPQMKREEKRLAITGPVAQMGAKIENGLVERILDDVDQNTDALPIMQHALMRTWNYWQRNSHESEDISSAHYDAVGGMNKALSIHANEVFNELNENQKKICEKLFKAITEKSDEGRGVRRPAKVGDVAVIANTSVAEVIDVVDKFRRPDKTLLMPPYNTALDEYSIIDISHESLMRIWEMLNSWVEEEAESVKLYLRLAEAAEMHQLGKAGLWRPPDLQIALNWQEAENPSKTWGLRYHKAYERSMLFLDFSKKQYEKEQRMKEKLQKRRLIAARITAIVLGLGAVVAFLFFLYGEQQRREAEKQRAEAKKQSIVAQEQAEIAHQESEKARQSEIEALEQKKIAVKEAERAQRNERIAREQKRLAELATHNALIQKARAEDAHEIALTEEKKAYNLRLLSIAKSMAIKSVSLTNPGQQGLVAQQAYLFNKEHGGKKHDPDVYNAMYYALKDLKDSTFSSLHGHSQNVRSLTSTPTGTFIYSAGSDGKVIRWDLNAENGKDILFESDSHVHKTIAVSPDKTKLLCGGDYPYLLLFDLSSAEYKPEKLRVRSTEIWHVGFTPDSRGFISVGSDNKLLLWTDNNALELLSSNVKLNAVAINPKKEDVLVGKSNGEVSIIDRTGRQQDSVLFKDPDGPIISLAFSKNGNLLAAGNEKGIVRIWDMTSRSVLATLTGHNARVNNIRFSNDGQRLATGSFDKTVRIWDVMKIYDPPIVLKDHNDWVWSIEFSQDGKKLLAGCKDNQIRVWPTDIELMNDIICGKIDRNLSQKEWEQFVAEDIVYEKTCNNKPEGEGVK